MNEISLSGKTISHYRILSRLGVGGMGEVYKGYDTKLDRPVALKILPADKVEDKDRVRRFIQEAKAASALNHPHIITIYDIGQTQPADGKKGESRSQEEERNNLAEGVSSNSQSGTSPIHYIAMEYIDGETLRNRIEQGQFDLRKVLEVLAQVADGLAAAHMAGIVHRDLKPENIMIRQDGYAKVLDFGLSKLTDVKSPLTTEVTQTAKVDMEHTQPGTMLGTIGYMSPEQVQAQSVDHRSDIFSFGCILHESATGKRAFEGDSLVDTLHKIVYAQPASIADSNPDAPVELQRIVRKCLAKDADKRYQSIKDVAVDLRELKEEYERAHGYSSARLLETVIDPGLSRYLGQKTGPLHQRRRNLKLYAGLAAGGLLILGVLVAIPLLNRPSSAGKLFMESNPGGARVFLNDEFVGSTPLPIKNLKSGTYKLRVELDGYESKGETLEVRERSDLQRSYLLNRVQTAPPTPSSAEKAPDVRIETPLSKTAPAAKVTAEKTAEKKMISPTPITETEKPRVSVTTKPARGNYTVHVMHGHGIFRKFCVGTLRVDSSGIEFQSSGPHAFKATYKGTKSMLTTPDKIALQGTGIPGGRIELQQIEKDSGSNLSEINAKIQEYQKTK